jgi:hypothetical protein
MAKSRPGSRRSRGDCASGNQTMSRQASPPGRSGRAGACCRSPSRVGDHIADADRRQRQSLRTSLQRFTLALRRLLSFGPLFLVSSVGPVCDPKVNRCRMFGRSGKERLTSFVQSGWPGIGRLLYHQPPGSRDFFKDVHSMTVRSASTPRPRPTTRPRSSIISRTCLISAASKGESVG